MTDWALKVPRLSNEDLRTVGASRIFFAHQSVGRNVLSGINPLYATAGEIAPQIVETRGPLRTSRSVLAHAGVGKNRDPLSKLTEFADILNDGLGANLDAAALKFCYADVTADTDIDALFDAYWTTLNGLQERYPDVRFVHATVPLTTDRGWKAKTKALLGQSDRRGPADNLARERYNSLMRARCGGAGMLFDIAAVEATIEHRPMVRRLKGERYFVLNRALSTDAGHLNSVGCKAAANEFIRVFALALR
ncbi:hypothetical protein MLP_48900 [Microlunatus phosphovorus NM-1]|uniref:SGNH hydrolase-type esterase domain-containing protein n=1 Tax=Microlunatus phosphovorus (strain ATCC 700054 / DSM 10555 / JCM 9379 / NBRC 101784 / NCIMB 13414 / VKM Ac-1990 / NM-1) TaxID=1032480 RepID=F5XFX0_MICPN|nr:hypothetical protein [Microlunatus phosphovorus]BAK37904.1 hypothetical protein MLP_48900 [Microlunatus phosphovorus NM-1]